MLKNTYEHVIHSNSQNFLDKPFHYSQNNILSILEDLIFLGICLSSLIIAMMNIMILGALNSRKPVCICLAVKFVEEDKCLRDFYTTNIRNTK